STIKKGERLILCAAADTSLFRKYGSTISLKTFPALSDDGKAICLYDSMGVLIQGVSYSPEWIAESLKRDGGWSLEMIDTDYPFYGFENWSASKSPEGGTPGKINSVSRVNDDSYFQGVVNVYAIDSKTLSVKFSEPVLSLSRHNEEITIEGETVQSITSSDILCREFLVSSAATMERGKQYTLEISAEVTDFAGNQAVKRTFVFGLAEKAENRDLMFNELLFDPLPGEADYVEFYNNSSKVLDASRLLLVNVSDQAADTSSAYFIADEPYCILPGSYYAITTGMSQTILRYPNGNPANIHQVKALPSMPDDKGHLILYNRELEKIDEVFYDEKMHFSLLAGNEGVSLEKLNVSMESGSASGWHSAAGSSGWGTPGEVNSVYSEVPKDGEEVTFSSARITPDSDGNEDFLTIGLNLEGAGNVISIMIFDEAGNLVRKLATNLLVEPGATLLWDGTSGDGSMLRSGIYVVLVTGYNEVGKVVKRKRVCAVIR
ncbi:MAG TPA: FlgD immunoglobulin-like domain containing protein, partial [Bacteroidales bacterium]|nr:FlgD immunoglobulin-like domain containing protein [Bacteroidales bacterium]